MTIKWRRAEKPTTMDSDASAALWPGHADDVVTLNSRGTVEGDDGMVSKACEALCQASRLLYLARPQSSLSFRLLWAAVVRRNASGPCQAAHESEVDCRISSITQASLVCCECIHPPIGQQQRKSVVADRKEHADIGSTRNWILRTFSPACTWYMMCTYVPVPKLVAKYLPLLTCTTN